MGEEEGSDLTMRVFNNTGRFQELTDHDVPELLFKDARGRGLQWYGISPNVVNEIVPPRGVAYIHFAHTPPGWTSVKIVEPLDAKPTRERPAARSAVNVVVTVGDLDWNWPWEINVTRNVERKVSGYANLLHFDRRGRLINVASRDRTGGKGYFSVDDDYEVDEIAIGFDQSTWGEPVVERMNIALEPLE